MSANMHWHHLVAHVVVAFSFFAIGASASLSRRLRALERSIHQHRRVNEPTKASYISRRPDKEYVETAKAPLTLHKRVAERFVLKTGSHPYAKGAPRRLYGGNLCSNHSICTDNEYCMDCGKCREHHESMSKDQQRRWTCDPCSKDTDSHCESGRYCHRSQDSVTNECPSFPGCRTHSECPENEYCYSCSKCHKYIADTGHRDELWECEPCPTTTGGFCGLISWCSLRGDSIDGQCPPHHGCDSHTDCYNGLYCESCDQCHAYQMSLPVNQRAHWSCAPCPTIGGGFCEQLRFCQIANDGIDGTCPLVRGCSSDIQCLPTEYCSDCSKCNSHRDSLPLEEQSSWTCDPCPTERGGSCRPTQFCQTAGDSIAGECPLVQGCATHTDCGSDEFCLSWDACYREIGQSCGTKPEKGGVCVRGYLCRPERSITGLCPVPLQCGEHHHCSPGFFCAPWADCVRHDPSKCGEEPLNRPGVCLPLQHCTSGLHAPVDGTCPVNRRVGGRVRVREGLKLSGGLQLATHHQAINSWPLSALEGYTFSLEARVGPIPGQDYSLRSAPVGLVKVYVRQGTNHSEGTLKLFFDLFGMEVSSEGALHIHTGAACDGPGPHFWASDEISPDPWVASGKWISNQFGIASGSFEIVTGRDYRQNSGRAVVIHASDGSKVACGLLAEEYVVAQLHDFGNQSRGLAHDDMEYVGIYRVASGQIREESRVELSCPSLEITVPMKPGFFYEARIHLSESEMAMRHSECSCIQRDGNHESCVRGAMVRYAGTPEAPQMLSKLIPVFFTDGGAFVNTQLTLYSLVHNITAPAILVDTTDIGEGDPSLGCPALDVSRNGLRMEPSLQELRAAGKVLPSDHVTGSWCVVSLSIDGNYGCSTTAKYKLCVVSGAKGVIFLQEDMGDDDAISIVLTEDAVVDMVPVIAVRNDERFVNALLSKQRPSVTIGPHVRAAPSENFSPSRGGIRVYELGSGMWYDHEDVKVNENDMLLTQEWMEFSHLRDVLFVCTSGHQITALDASSPTSGLPLLGYAAGVECHASSLFRDYHIAEVKQGDNFYTLVIDPNPKVPNRIYVFDTTDLSSWRLLSEIHANWEYDKAGLGQVIAHDGKLLVSWHCSTLYCGGDGPSRSESRGERLYVLDLTDLASGIPPPVIAVTDLPMTEGSLVRDIACDFNGICLLSLTWDGLVVVDIAEGPNQFQVVGQHSATFNVANFPQQLAYLRMVAGAQRIAPSPTHSGRFYVESWSLLTDLYLAGATLGESLRFDNLWVVEFEEYFRPLPLDAAPHDPAVHATLRLAISMDEVLAKMPSGKIDDVERLVAAALQRALNVDGQRIVVTGAKSSLDRQSVLVSFHIVPGDGAAPDTLFNMLQRQLEIEGSAINTGVIAPYTQGAKLEQNERVDGVKDKTDGGTSKTDTSSQQTVAPIGNTAEHDDSSPHMFIMMMITALCIIVAVWAVAFGFRARRTAKLAVARANALAAQAVKSTPRHPVVPVEEAPIMTAQPQNQTPESLGYVIGRPGDNSSSANVSVPSGPSAAYVVGTPIDPRRRSAQNAATAGLALSQMDTQKLAIEEEDTNLPASSSCAGTTRESENPPRGETSSRVEQVSDLASLDEVESNADSSQAAVPSEAQKRDDSSLTEAS